MQTGAIVAATLAICAASMGQEADPDPPGREHAIPLFMAYMDAEGREGFIRIINHSDEAGTVEIVGYDDAGAEYPVGNPARLSIGARETKHLNSEDLELGNEGKGLDGRLGDGEGNWRLRLTGGGLDIEPLAYIRTQAGFLTSMNDVVPGPLRNHRVPVFNPAKNMNQRSWLRLINPGDTQAQVTVVGRDDAALPESDEPVPARRPFSLTIPPRGARVLTAQDLEDGNADSAGIGQGEGKWSLDVGSDVPIQVVNLMSTDMGNLSNLSAASSGYRDAVGLWQVAFADELGGDGYLVLMPDSRLYAWLPEGDDVDRIARGTFERTTAGIAGEGELFESGLVVIGGDLRPVGGSEDFTLTAAYRSGDWIRGEYTVGGASRAFRGWAYTGFGRGGAIHAIAGSWHPAEGDAADLSESLEVPADGAIDLEFPVGTVTCNAVGEVGPVNPAFSVYEADVTTTCSLLVVPSSAVDFIVSVFDSPDDPGGANHALVLAIVHDDSKIGLGSLFRRDEES